MILDVVRLDVIYIKNEAFDKLCQLEAEVRKTLRSSLRFDVDLVCVEYDAAVGQWQYEKGAKMSRMNGLNGR